MQAALWPHCQICRLWLLIAFKGRHCLLVTSGTLHRVKKKKKKKRRCCCGSSSPRTTTPLPEERSPFSGFLLCFSGDYQLLLVRRQAAKEKASMRAASNYVLPRVARQLLQLLRWLQVLLWCHWSLWPFISASRWSVSVRRPQSVLIHSSRKSSRGQKRRYFTPLLLLFPLPASFVVSWKKKNSVPVVCTLDISSPSWKIRIEDNPVDFLRTKGFKCISGSMCYPNASSLFLNVPVAVATNFPLSQNSNYVPNRK